jgi:hypothetical protein
MRIMVVIRIWVEDAGLIPSSTSDSWDETAGSASDTFSADSGWVRQKRSMSTYGW